MMGITYDSLFKKKMTELFRSDFVRFNVRFPEVANPENKAAGYNSQCKSVLERYYYHHCLISISNPIEIYRQDNLTLDHCVKTRLGLLYI